MYTLIIAEKPSAAKRIAYSLSTGKVERLYKNGVTSYKIENNGKKIIVAPAVGHLFLLGEKNKKSQWTYPVFDIEWKPVFLTNRWVKKYYENIKDLAKNADGFIAATDYDIEGSVIAYNILRFICGTEKAKRMKFSTLTSYELLESYKNAMPELDFPQIEAGLARHVLDFIWGINLSRALTLSLKHVNVYKTLSTGRVQGPTLKILDERENEIKNFVPKPFWLLKLSGVLKNQKITANHINGEFWNKNDAEKIFKKCEGKKAVVSEIEIKRYEEKPPFPFDLTTLQRESYKYFGYSPKLTLDIAQSLYENALISYPRTSSQKLPERIGYKNIIIGLSKQSDYAEICKNLLSKDYLKPNEGDKEDPAHPAIFPIGTKPGKLNEYQKNVYDLIVRRFLACFSDPALKEYKKIVIDVDGERFFFDGVKILKKNWMDIYGKVSEKILPDVKKGDELKNVRIEIVYDETKPSKRYNQASILKKLEDLGLGTKGTRALILQTLYDRGYIENKDIRVTKLGSAVVEALEKYCPEIISVELTRTFEEKMKKIQEGEISKEKVIEDAKKVLTKILDNFKKNEKEIGKELSKGLKEDDTIGKCRCGGDLKIIKTNNKFFVGCSNYPKCDNIYPLPRNAKIEKLNRICEKCKTPVIKIVRKGKKSFEMCLDPNCQTKAKWKKTKKS